MQGGTCDTYWAFAFLLEVRGSAVQFFKNDSPDYLVDIYRAEKKISMYSVIFNNYQFGYLDIESVVCLKSLASV